MRLWWRETLTEDWLDCSDHRLTKMYFAALNIHGALQKGSTKKREKKEKDLWSFSHPAMLQQQTSMYFVGILWNSGICGKQILYLKIAHLKVVSYSFHLARILYFVLIFHKKKDIETFASHCVAYVPLSTIASLDICTAAIPYGQFNKSENYREVHSFQPLNPQSPYRLITCRFIFSKSLFCKLW